MIKNNHGTGIDVRESGTADIIDNTISSNAKGLYWHYSHQSLITRNNITENSDWAIDLWHSSENLIWNNTFAFNSEGNARARYSITSHWNNSDTGNIYCDYYEIYPDAALDGRVWDTPYEIEGFGTDFDHFPLFSTIQGAPEETEGGESLPEETEGGESPLEETEDDEISDESSEETQRSDFSDDLINIILITSIISVFVGVTILYLRRGRKRKMKTEGFVDSGFDSEFETNLD